MVKLNFNPILISAGIFAFLIYFNIIPMHKNFCKESFVPSMQISYVEGIVASNPIKISEKYYSLLLNLKSVSSKKIKSTAKGNVTIFVPSQVIEAFYPNKLFSKNRNIINNLLPIEQGINICAHVKPVLSKTSENNCAEIYIVNEIKKTYFNNSFYSKIQKIRGLCRIQFKRLMSYWGSAGGLFLALLTSSKEYLNPSMNSAFRISGLSHILALSGMHLSMISSILGIANNFTKKKKRFILFQLFMIIIFVWFAGRSPSLLRALISFMVVSCCKIFDVRVKDGINILSVVFLFHAIISPSDLANLGFMFSYSALLGIFILDVLIKKYISNYLPPIVSGSLSSSISANCFTAPISLKYFGFYSPSGIICTLFVSPLITVFLYCGIFFMILNLIFPITCNISKFIINFIYSIITVIVNIFSNFPVIKI